MMQRKVTMSPEEQHSRAKKAAVIFCLGIFAATMFATLHDDSVRVFARVLGERPMGLPIRGVLAAFVVLALLPMPFAAWHGFRVLFRGYSDPSHLGGFGFLSLLTVPEKHSDLKRSRAIVLVTIIGYVGLMVAWIVFAESRGI